MVYGLVFSMMTAMLALCAMLLGHWGWLLAWPIVSFLAVSIAYFQGSPAMFGKRADGSRSWAATLLLMPYLLYVAGLWHVLRWVSREPAYNVLTNQLWIGRRLLVRELPERVALVVDLTSEFTRPRGWDSRTKYLALPILDAAAPPVEQLLELVERLRGEQPVIYLHCAQGHGRTGLVAALYLLVTGVSDAPEEALAQVRTARPGVRLNPQQLRALEHAAIRQV